MVPSITNRRSTCSTPFDNNLTTLPTLIQGRTLQFVLNGATAIPASFNACRTPRPISTAPGVSP
jgi:hypothetical protein